MTIPLVAILALQYISLAKLKRASAGNQRLGQQRYLETLADKLGHAYENRAEQILNLSPQEFADDSQVAAHFEKTKWSGARLSFVVRYNRQGDAQSLFFNPATHLLESHPDSDDQRRVNSVTAPWRVLRDNGTSVQPQKVRVTQLDPKTRIMVVPATDESGKVIGVVGVFVDHNYFKNNYLARAIGSFQSESAALQPPGDVIITVRDPFQQLAYSTKPAKENQDEVSVPMKFIYTDWRLGIQSDRLTPEQWAQTNFLVGLSLSILMTGVLVIAITLALRATAREMRLSQMKSDFVSNVSHELRTPLSSVRIFAEFLHLGWIEDGQKVRECGEYIETESRRLTQLIDNILDFSKIESGQKEYEFAEADVGEVVSEALKAFEMPLKQRGISLGFEPPEDLPRSSIDREAIAQAFMNLLDNAAKYSGASTEIIVRVWAEDGSINISVRDHGVGIPNAEQKLIFGKFYRVSTGLVHDVKGSGLGLAIVDHIVKAHGGAVVVESEPGRGSTFVIQLPSSSQLGVDDERIAREKTKGDAASRSGFHAAME